MSSPDHSEHIFVYFFDGSWKFSDENGCLKGKYPSKEKALEAGKEYRENRKVSS